TVAGTAADYSNAAGEVINTWQQVGSAGLGPTGSSTASNTPVPTNFPAGKVGGVGTVPISIAGVNYFLAGMTPSFPLSTASGGITATAYNTLPANADGDVALCVLEFRWN